MDYAKERAKEEGKKEEKIKIAKNLLDILDIETISLKTGLSIEEIKSLK
jgi:predicted transposase YdaD